MIIIHIIILLYLYDEQENEFGEIIVMSIHKEKHVTFIFSRIVHVYPKKCTHTCGIPCWVRLAAPLFSLSEDASAPERCRSGPSCSPPWRRPTPGTWSPECCPAGSDCSDTETQPVKTRQSLRESACEPRGATVTHPSSRELVLLLPCSDSALMVSIWMRSCSCSGGDTVAHEPAVSTALERNGDEWDWQLANLLMVRLLNQLLGVVQLSDQGVLRTNGQSDRHKERRWLLRRPRY